MKRFTDTDKWCDSWFRKLKPVDKCFWEFILDRCDNAGVWKVDLEAAEFFIGSKLDKERIMEVFSGRIKDIGRGRWWVPAFISFQCGELSETCIPHKKIVLKLKEHGLYDEYKTTLQPRVETTLKEEEEEEDKEEEEEVRGECKGGAAVDVLDFLKEKTGRNYQAVAANLKPIIARLKEVNGDVEGVKKMIERQCARWLGKDQEEYLRPETLFGATKFHGYYASKDFLPGMNGVADHTKPW